VNRFTFSTLAYPELSLEQVLEKARSIGVDIIELRVSTDGIRVHPNADPGRVKAILADKGAEAVLLSSYVRTCNPTHAGCDESLKLLEDVMRLAYVLECRRVRIFAGFLNTIEESVVAAEKFLEKAYTKAENYNVVLLFETHDYFAERHNLIHLLDLLNRFRDVAGILYDPANMLMRGVPVEESLRLVKDFTFHVHIKDFKPVPEGEHRYTRPGEGVLPICRIVRELYGRGVVFSVEWEKMWIRDLEDPDLVTPLYLNYMKRCIT